MKDNETLTNYELTVAPRKNGEFLNLYVYVDGKRFEIVPHCRTIRETAYFYALVSRASFKPNKSE